MNCRLLVLILSVLFLSQETFGQDAEIKGMIADSSANSSVALASVVVLRRADSVLAAYGRSDEHGKFKISDLSEGDYILLITFPKYGNFVEEFSLMEGDVKKFNTIYLTEKAKLLDEIVIRQSPILIKGDTTEYIADSFKVRENAPVEELLKELPGIQVDKDGKIIAQGQQVQKVLVDGDEFFSDDPTIATRNLRADAIDRVQVYDKKSDQAAFTGIDDGQEKKTIDLKLKANAKKGYFGKASVAGLDKYYNATAMINAFKAKRKLSAFGVASSTDRTGLDWSDSRSMGFDNSSASFSDGTVSVMSTRQSGELSASGGYGEGLPESVKAGLHYSDKWNEAKNSAGGNYLFNKLAQRMGGNSFSENTLLDSIYYSRNESSSHSNRLQNALNAVAEFTVDSSSSFRITANGQTGTGNSNSEDYSDALSAERKIVNSSNRRTSESSSQSRLNANAIWRKKFKTKGRTLSVNLNQQYSESVSDGFLFNTANFYDFDENVVKKEVTDQKKVNTTENQTVEGRVSYTNPIGKQSYFEVNYSYNLNNSYQKRFSYDKDDGDKYVDLNDSLSSDFKYVYQTNTGGLNYRYNRKNITFSAGGNVANTAVKQNNRFEKKERTYSYFNIFPQANLQYKMNAFTNLNLGYSGSTRQPTIDQLQPLQNNYDPLNIVIGNPDLKQSFSNNISLNYSSFQMMKEQFLFIRANFSTISDQISSSYTIDEEGKRITQYINVNGNNSFNLNGNYSKTIPETSWRIAFTPNLNISKNTNYINSNKNVSNSLTLTPGLGVWNRKTGSHEFSVEYMPTFTNSKSSISTVANRKYWTHIASFDGRYSFPAKIDIGTDIGFEFREKLNEADDKNQLILWNAFIEKRFLEKDQLVLRISMHDILDQNKGYQRIVQPNAIIERNYLSFQRYGLITVTYNFNTTGAAPAKGPRIMF